MATTAVAGGVRRSGGSLPARLAGAIWGTLTSVRFAVLLITGIALAGLAGTLIRQLPSGAIDDPAARARAIAEIHAAWDPISIGGVTIGPALVDLFDALGLFRIFSAPWFVLLLTVLVLAIVCCTIDRTPRLWRSLHHVTVPQPGPFFDPSLPGRAALATGTLDTAAVDAILRRRRFRVRTETSADGATTWIYGDRWQYFKLATLLTHLGLICFLGAGAVTAAAGFETVLFLAPGQTAPVQPVGTPHNLLVRVNAFEKPQRPDGSFIDFRTDLSVFRDGEEIARQTVRVNDPLLVDGFAFHQNTFGPAVSLTIRDAAGALLWTGPILLAGELLGMPQGFLTIPGTQTGLLVLLTRLDDGTSRLVLQGVEAVPGSDATATRFQALLEKTGTTDPAATGGVSIAWDETMAWTGMVIRNDPGQGLIWIAFTALIIGLVLTFYFPRRRCWVRIDGDRCAVALLGDRSLDLPRELASIADELARRGGPGPAGAATPA